MSETTYFNLRKMQNDVIFMTPLHVDLNEAVDRYATHIASLLIAHSCNRTKYKMATTFGLSYEIRVGGK